MRAHEAFPGIPVYVSNDEHAMYERLCKEGQCRKRDLTEFEQETCNSLVNKSIILRKKIDGDLFYKTRPNKQSAETV